MRFINYCKGCLGCVSSGECVIHDDMSGILEDMVDADVIVFASPIYFNTISGQMKTMIDRLTPKARQLMIRIIISYFPQLVIIKNHWNLQFVN